MEVFEMRRSRVLLRICALGLGASIALAPLTAASAKSKPTGVNRGSNFCQLLISEGSVGQKYATTIESAFSSGNVAKAKAAILAEFNFGTQYISQALAAGKIPAPIQSALRYFLTVYQQRKTAVGKATSLTALEAALTALTRLPKFTSESQTISSYVATQCGSITATT